MPPYTLLSRKALQEALKVCQGKTNKATAEYLGVHPRALRRAYKRERITAPWLQEKG